MHEQLILFINNCWVVLGQMSPYLLLGFLISGILSVFISPVWIEKHLGGGKFSSIVKATLFGIPLPLCSCGVIPVAASLRKHGASKSATTSFLLSTPQTGVDSILATWGLMGWVFAIFRPIAALITGIFGGVLVAALDEENGKDAQDQALEKGEIHEKISHKIKSALWYGLVTLPGEIARALLVGILIAGLISTFVSAGIMNQYLSNYYLTLVVMLFIGIPLYVCSTSSIPIALSFIHLGATPGAALVFLISGPATNAAAITVVWKVLGKKSALIYLLTVALGSLIAGATFDSLNQSWALNATNHLPHCHETSASLLENISAVFMLIVLAFSYYQSRKSPSCCSSCSSTPGAGQHSIVINIEGMSCGNCANAIKRVLNEIDGVTSAEVSLAEKNALVTADFVDPTILVSAINELGYQASAKKH